MRWWIPLAVVLSSTAHAGPVQGGYRLGLHTGGVRDDLLVSLGFGGAGPRFGGTLEGRTGPGDLSVDLGLGGRLLGNRFGQLALTIDEQADVAWTVRLGSGAWVPSVGAAAAWDSRMSYLESWDNAHGYWLGTQWVGPAARLRGSLGDADVDLGLAVAVVGGAGRPPTYRWDKQDPLKRPGFWLFGPLRGEKAYAIDHLQVVRLDGSVVLPPGERKGRWTVGLDTRLDRLDQPAVTIDLSAFVYFGRTWGAP